MTIIIMSVYPYIYIVYKCPFLFLFFFQILQYIYIQHLRQIILQITTYIVQSTIYI
eukprot:UN01881